MRRFASPQPHRQQQPDGEGRAAEPVPPGVRGHRRYQGEAGEGLPLHRLLRRHPRPVSCADTLALIARDVVHLDKGPYWDVPTGRRDGGISVRNEALQMLPAFSANISTLKSQFSGKGLSVKDLVVLSGGHTIGNAHCFTVTNRIYNFTGRGDSADTDPTRDMNYVARLRSKCSPSSADRTKLLEMDPGSFKTFDNSYFKLVAKRRGLFQSDAALLDDPETKAHVFRLANASSDEFFRDFAVSMVNMGGVGVLTGGQGEVPRSVLFVNPLCNKVDVVRSYARQLREGARVGCLKE